MRYRIRKINNRYFIDKKGVLWGWNQITWYDTIERAREWLDNLERVVTATPVIIEERNIEVG